jgi:hypothetical protein
VLRGSEHVIILNICMHDHVMFIRLYKINHIYFLIIIIVTI